MDRETRNYLYSLIFGITLIITFLIELFILNSNSVTAGNFISGYLIFIFWGILGFYLLIKGGIMRIDEYFFVLFFIGALYAISNLVLLYMNSIDLIKSFGIGFQFILILAYFIFGVMNCFLSIILIFEWRFIKKNQSWDSEKDHTGIVIIHYNWPLKDISLVGVDTLIKGIYEKEPYKIYNCYEPEEIMLVVKNPKVKRLWIFGHGVKHGVSTDSGTLYYCNFQNEPQKEFVAQLHCNPQGGKSSCDYLLDRPLPGNCIVSDSYRHAIQNVLDIRRYLSKIK